MYINYNGRIVEEKRFTISLRNRSFLYGDGLFETIKIFRGKALFFNQHYVRFIEGLTALQMEIPEHWNVPYYKNLIEELTTKNAHSNARVRLTFWRSDGGFYTPENYTAEFIIQSFPIQNEFYSINSIGLTIGVYYELLKAEGKFSSFKSANALPFVMGGVFATQKKLDDVIILNSKGKPIETLHSNIFLIQDKIVLTPDVSEGCVNGVMRRVLIKLLKKMQIELIEKSISLEEIQNAESLFITNTMHGMQWVGKYEDKNYEQGITSMLLARLNEHIMDSAV